MLPTQIKVIIGSIPAVSYTHLAWKGETLADYWWCTLQALSFLELNMFEFCSLSVVKAYEYISNLKLSKKDEIIASEIIKEIKSRLTFLENVGLGYLTLARSAATLSGGEAQRIRLATQIGSSLMGVLYILDEPSIGLHQSCLLYTSRCV